ncbi:unnamed protein product, partial [Ectocarpus sp. 12 AP-2014]
MFNARALIRSGPEAAAALTTRYQEQTSSSNDASDAEQQLRQPISASEVDEASQMIFQRAPATPSDYVFSPSATVPSGPAGGQVYPRLRHNQVLRREVLAMGHRLAAHPGVQNAILDDLVEQGRRVPSGRRGIHPNLQGPPGNERGLARLVDMLDSEEESSHRSTRTSRSGRSGSSGHLMLQRDRRGLFDYDDEPPLPHLHLDPRVSAELEGVYAEVQADGWQPWREEEKSDGSESGLSSSRLSDGRLGCSCKKCHASSGLSLGTEEEEAQEGTCWKDVLAEFECDICFDVLVGVHVLDNCGHTFCGACMERWIDNAPQGECPVCRTPVDKLVPVRKMDDVRRHPAVRRQRLLTLGVRPKWHPVYAFAPHVSSRCAAASAALYSTPHTYDTMNGRTRIDCGASLPASAGLYLYLHLFGNCALERLALRRVLRKIAFDERLDLPSPLRSILSKAHCLMYSISTLLQNHLTRVQSD